MTATDNQYIFNTNSGYYVRINNNVMNLHRYFTDYVSANNFVLAVTK